MPPQGQTVTQPIQKGTRAQIADPENVMSYLHREHNEVTTIWRNPNTPGYDDTRFERVFNGVVPFLAYNTHGHPILYNDTEIDHHGHPEFNMVHGATIEQNEILTQQAAGQVETQNTAEVTQTSPNPIENPTAGTVGGD